MLQRTLLVVCRTVVRLPWELGNLSDVWAVRIHLDAFVIGTGQGKRPADQMIAAADLQRRVR